MGCDIHLYTEYRKDKTWYPADAWQPDIKWGESALRIPYHLQPFRGRDYNFFAWLANVRNGTWGEEIPVISEPKGLPEDVCPTIKMVSEEYGIDGHSHSWVMLKELDDAYKEMKNIRVRFHAAFKPTPEWLALPEDKRPAPESYAAASYGPEGECPKYHWQQPLSDLIERPYSQLRDYLWNVRFEFGVDEDNVRAVFWFDN